MRSRSELENLSLKGPTYVLIIALQVATIAAVVIGGFALLTNPIGVGAVLLVVSTALLIGSLGQRSYDLGPSAV